MCLFKVWFSQGICPVVGLIGYMVVLFLVFKGISILFFIMAVSTYIATNRQECSRFSTPSLAFIVCGLFDYGQSDWCEMIIHCNFDLHFSNNE